MGSRPPAPLRRWQLGARVVPGDLCSVKTESLEAVLRLRAPFQPRGALLLLGYLACWNPAQLGTLDLGTFEVQHETLAQARVWGSGGCLELQHEIGPRGEEAAARLRSTQLGQDSGAGTVSVEQCQHVPFTHIQAAGSRTSYGGWTRIRLALLQF